MLAVSGLAGVLAAGLALPLVGGAGLLARDSVQSFDDLPMELQRAPLPQRSVIYAADETTALGSFYYENRQSVSLDDVAPIMRKAIVAIEDSRFYEHHGFDLRGTLRALVSTSSGTRQGGSTITQQYVKNVLIEDAKAQDDQAGIEAARAANAGRKIRELRYSLALEEKLSKDEILERYLNTVLFGAGAYGIDAAAERYFSKSASQLTLPEAALLAGAVQNPSRYDPTRNPKQSTARRDVVLRRMAELHYITEAEAVAAVASPLVLHPSDIQNGCATSSAPFFCDYVVKEILTNEVYGPDKSARTRLLLRGGLSIYTTLDTTAQRAAQIAVDTYVPRDPDKNAGVAAAIAMVEPGTGYIKAMAIDRDFGTGPSATQVNYAADYAHGGNNGRQSGSTFKMFTLVTALQQKLPSGTRIDSPAKVTVDGFVNCDDGNKEPPYTVRNAGDSESGFFSLAEATWHSVNTYFVQLEQRVSQCEVAKTAAAMGAKRADLTPLRTTPCFTLGCNEVAPLDLANSYATLAAHGLHCPTVAITRMMSTVDGETTAIAIPPTECDQAIDAKVADAATAILTGVLTQGTAKGLSLDRPSAGKTGTNNDERDALFAGFTPQLATAVWVGNPRGSDSPKYWLQKITINGKYYSRVYGATIPGPIWKLAMTGALEGQPVKNFTTPSSTVLNGEAVTVPDVTGMPLEEAKAKLRQAGFQVEVNPQYVDAAVPLDTIASTEPAANATSYLGQKITLFVSNGSVVATTTPDPSMTPDPSASGSPTPPLSPGPSSLITPPAVPPPTRQPPPPKT